VFNTLQVSIDISHLGVTLCRVTCEATHSCFTALCCLYCC